MSSLNMFKFEVKIETSLIKKLRFKVRAPLRRGAWLFYVFN